MKDIEKSLLDLLSNVLDASNAIKADLENYLKDSSERPAIDFFLLKILWCSIEANAKITPRETTGEIYGLPRELCDSETRPGLTIRHADRPSNWDFTPWLKEKLGKMQDSALLLVENWLRELEDVKLHPEAPMTPQEYLRDCILMEFHEVQRMAKTVFEQLCNDNIRIIQHD